MSAQGKRVAILIENNYQEMEFYYPFYRLQEAGAKVTALGAQEGTVYKSKLGYPAKADSSIADVQAEDFDCVIIPGGYAPDIMRMNDHLLNFVRDSFEKGKIVAAICHAGWVLCSAGIVDGKRLTSVKNIHHDLRNAGADWVDEPVVRDGNLITSRVPSDLPQFAKAIVQALEDE